MAQTTGYRDEQLIVIAAGETTGNIRGRTMGSTQRAYIEKISVVNEDNKDAVIEISIETPSDLAVIEAGAFANNARWEIFEPQCWIYPGERIRLDFSGAVAADRIKAHVVGVMRFDAGQP